MSFERRAAYAKMLRIPVASNLIAMVADFRPRFVRSEQMRTLCRCETIYNAQVAMCARHRAAVEFRADWRDLDLAFDHNAIARDAERLRRAVVTSPR